MLSCYIALCMFLYAVLLHYGMLFLYAVLLHCVMFVFICCPVTLHYVCFYMLSCYIVICIFLYAVMLHCDMYVFIWCPVIL